MRKWLGKRAKMITLYAGAVAAVIAVVTGWNQLDLPRPATHAEVQAVQQYAAGTRDIVLELSWARLKETLESARARLARDPTNSDLIRAVVNAEMALRNVETKLNRLRQR